MPRKLAHIGTVQKIKEKRGEKKVRIKNPIQFKGKRKRMSQSGLCVIGKKVFELSQIEKLAIGNGLKQKDVQSLSPIANHACCSVSIYKRKYAVYYVR